MQEDSRIVISDGWSFLQQFTSARIALGRTGVSVPAREMLQFKMAHAHARDAVFSRLDKEALAAGITSLQLPFLSLQSKASDRHTYLQRPDLGRTLSDVSKENLQAFQKNNYDICINIADGLSAEAVNKHAIPVIQRLIPFCKQQSFSIAPVCLIEQGRVAVADETGNLLNARLSLIFIGERPGLSSPDSMGAYLTFAPQTGLTDESRNCVSNIRPEGLCYEAAASRISYLLSEALHRQMSGVMLKDESPVSLLPS